MQLNVYKKGDPTPSFNGDDSGAAITGLAAGTVVATGDYEVTHTGNNLSESSRVAVEGFTVLAADSGA
ncbi:hypothetical protein [Lentilactobacillus senioris]|uniref:hypothetical protein n=1 Tax=Lentilactobacillus senioris TaxID=931534 RepID=UPI003D2A6545